MNKLDLYFASELHVNNNMHEEKNTGGNTKSASLKCPCGTIQYSRSVGG